MALLAFREPGRILPTMRILHPDDFLTSPWKNGGGITNEIARAEEAGRLLWRLSIAEVASDGPFSRFEGLARILTVIEGAGLQLGMPTGTVAALPKRPVAFSGDIAVDCMLKNGAVRDFNVIYDPDRIEASVRLLEGSERPQAHDGGLLALTGEIEVGRVTLPAGSLALGRLDRIRCANNATALLVTLRPLAP